MATPFKRGKQGLDCVLRRLAVIRQRFLHSCRDAGDGGGDGGGEGASEPEGLLCPPVHPPHEVSQGQLLPALEVQEGEALVGGVPVPGVSSSELARAQLLNIYRGAIIWIPV